MNECSREGRRAVADEGLEQRGGRTRYAAGHLARRARRDIATQWCARYPQFFAATNSTCVRAQSCSREGSPAPLWPIPVRQCPEGQLAPANLWFRNAPDGEMLREMKHTSDTFERVLSLLIVPKFYPRWASDGEEGEDDTYDRFIGGGRLRPIADSWAVAACRAGNKVQRPSRQLLTGKPSANGDVPRFTDRVGSHPDYGDRSATYAVGRPKFAQAIGNACVFDTMRRRQGPS